MELLEESPGEIAEGFLVELLEKFQGKQLQKFQVKFLWEYETLTGVLGRSPARILDREEFLMVLPRIFSSEISSGVPGGTFRAIFGGTLGEIPEGTSAETGGGIFGGIPSNTSKGNSSCNF